MTRAMRSFVTLGLFHSMCCSVVFAMLPEQPIPRVSPDRHVGFITKTDISMDGRLALTVSNDKTARIWDLEKRRLERTIRVPTAPGHEGRLYSGAISADGKRIAVGGFTGMAGNGNAVVYIVDLEQDNFIPLGSPPLATVDNLLFSRDGKFLAVAFSDGYGLYILDLNSEQLLVAHVQQRVDRMLGMDFGPDGSIVVSSIDGSINKYGGADFQLIASAKLPPDTEPMHVRFSPDGTQLALGYRAAPKVTLLDAESLTVIRHLDASQQPEQIGLIAAEWSDDGQYVYAGGLTGADTDTPLLRWALNKPDTPEVILIEPKRIGDIHRTYDGHILYVASKPSIGLLDSNGKRIWHADSLTADIRAEDPSSLLVSRDGLTVQFPFDRSGNAIGKFNAATIDPTTSIRILESSANALFPPGLNSTSWQVEMDREGFLATLNGKTLPLESREAPRSYTLSRDGQQLFLGTSWFLRAFSADGAPIWQTETTGEVNLLNSSLDGRWLVAGISDGTIRWFRTSDGAEVMAFFPHANGKEWIAWIPQGYYMSSLYGDELIGWQMNNGWNNAPDFYKAVQFERVLYRPDVVRAYLQSYGDPTSINAILGANAFTIDDLKSIRPPDIKASTRVDPASGQMLLSVDAATDTLAMQELAVYVNGIPIEAGPSRQISMAQSASLSRTLALPLEPGENRVRVEVTNGKALSFEELWVDAVGDSQQPPGDLYVLAVGVSEFDDDDIPDLNFAAKDAKDLADQLKESSEGIYRNAFTHVVADGISKPSATAVRDALGFLQQAGANDSVILFFASHGLVVANDYYFAPADARIERKNPRETTPDDLVLDTFLRWNELFEAMRMAAGKRLMIVDTCASAGITGPADLFNLQKRSASSKIAFMTASAGNQESQELIRRKQGLFTFTVLTALRDRYNPDGGDTITLSEVFTLAARMVPSWRELKNLVQTPELITPDFLADIPLAAAPVTTASEGM